MKPKHLPQNLLKETWIDLDSDELRLLLSKRFSPGHGQYDGDDGKLYLPLARAQSRIVMTFDGNEIVVVEPGQAFDVAEWERVSQEIEREILTGTPKTGRDYSFSSFPVQGSWRGRRSGVQILPAPDGAPRAAGAHDPFILEFPIKGSDLLFITNHRRIREHRKLTLLLNALLAARMSCLPPTTSSPLGVRPPRPGQAPAQMGADIASAAHRSGGLPEACKTRSLVACALAHQVGAGILLCPARSCRA
jgi:hypothetical protein